MSSSIGEVGVKFASTALLITGALLAGAQPSLAGAVTGNMYVFATKIQCQVNVSEARAMGKTINQDCTYAGSYFLWFQLNSGPWIADFN